ncbi:MAG: hypothetical protein KAU14_03950 [Thermoplasmata archaeon]|nr:hypothetical protein [Thermoplasmata archaeon]
MKWRDLEGTVARMFEKGAIKGFRKQDIVLGPGEALIIIEDGKIDEVLTQTRLNGIAGGFRNWFARKTGIGKDTVFLFVDTRPFELDAPFEGTTKDYIPLKGQATVKMQINVNDAPRLLNFMKEYLVPTYRQKGIFRKREVFDGFETEGRTLTRDVINNKILKEMSAKVFSPVIARHDAEEFHGDTRVVKDLQTEAMVQLRKTLDMWGILLQELYARFVETDYERTRMYAARRHLEADMEDADFVRVIRDSERRGELQKTEVLKAEEAKDITHGKAVERYKNEKLTHLELEKIEDAQDMETMTKMVELKEEMKAQKIKEFQETELRTKELEKQAEVEKARIEAEKAKYDLDTFKEAEEREREHQIKTMGQYSKVLGGAKGKPELGGRICMHCGRTVDPEWKVCAYCGGKLG